MNVLLRLVLIEVMNLVAVLAFDDVPVNRDEGVSFADLEGIILLFHRGGIGSVPPKLHLVLQEFRKNRPVFRKSLTVMVRLAGLE